uniref:Uncharacterized protein n=1 Tax=Anopheles arabiensis TaxID=7173 RepID=A0A182IG17_ANOAR
QASAVVVERYAAFDRYFAEIFASFRRSFSGQSILCLAHLLQEFIGKRKAFPFLRRSRTSKEEEAEAVAASVCSPFQLCVRARVCMHVCV